MKYRQRYRVMGFLDHWTLAFFYLTSGKLRITHYVLRIA
jgi:hypothetical protein